MRRDDVIYPRLLVMGHARHGKDTVCEILRDEYGFTFTSSSLFCAVKVVFPALVAGTAKPRPFMGPLPKYADAQACFEDRGNHRELWYELIKDYNKHDPARLGRQIFESHDIYCGIRSKREFHALEVEGAFDISVWVDREDHLPREPSNSMTLQPWMADFTIDNNGDIADLKHAVREFANHRLVCSMKQVPIPGPAKGMFRW